MGELSIRHAHTTANTSTGGRRRNANGRDVSELDVAALDTSFRETQRRYREAVGEEKGQRFLYVALDVHIEVTSLCRTRSPGQGAPCTSPTDLCNR